ILLEVLNGGLETRGQPVGADLRALALVERVRIDGNGGRQRQLPLDAVEAGGDDPRQGDVWVGTGVRGLELDVDRFSLVAFERRGDAESALAVVRYPVPIGRSPTIRQQHTGCLDRGVVVIGTTVDIHR